VTLIVAIEIINASVLANFRRTIDLIAGPAQLEVALGVGEVGFPEAIVEEVRRDPGVDLAVPLVRGTISVADGSGETLHLFGADLTAEAEFERYQVALTTDRRAVLRSLGDPGTILVTGAFAARRALAPGERLRLSTPSGVGEFKVVGLLDASGVAIALGGQLAVMDLPAAQRVLGKTGRVDQIDVVVRGEADVETVRARLQAGLPSALVVARPVQRGEHYERVFASFQAMLTGLSLLCLVAGVYIIYNTTSTGAVHRALSMGRLRVIGADGRQLFRLLMLEALVLGVIGVGLGTPSGIVLAHLLVGMVADSMGVIFQLHFPVESFTIDPWHQAAIGVIGTSAALFASYFAARNLAVLDPLEVMRTSTRQIARQVPTRRLVVWWLAIVVLAAAALAVEVAAQSIAWGNVGSTLWNGSVFVIAVPVVVVSARVLSGLLPRVFGPEGRIAADSLFSTPTRTGVTVAALALVLTVGVTVSSLAVSFQRSVGSYYDEGGLLPGDLVVSAVTTEGGWLETPLVPAVVDEIRAVPGVKAVETLRFLYGQIYRDERIALVALSDGFLDPERYDARWYRTGDPVQAAASLRAGVGVNIGTAIADRFGLGVGDEIELDTPTGPARLRVMGVTRDYIADRGTITLSRRLLIDRWQEPTVSRVNVFLDPNVSVDEGKSRIAAQLGDRYRLKMLTLGEVVAYHAEAIGRAFAFTDAIQLLIIIVTIAGIFDVLVAAIVERRRELALWRVVGADERAVRRSVVLESATIGTLGVGLGIAVGLVTAWIWVAINFRYLLGYYLEYHLAFWEMIWYATLVLVMAVAAGYAAAYYATRQPILEGVQTE